MKKDIKIPEINIFINTVSKYSKQYKLTEHIYIDAIKNFKQRKLSELTKKDTISILEPFLLKWGRMSRVLGKKGCEKIRIKIVELNNQLIKYREITLLDFDINEEKEEIKRIYNIFKSIKAINRKVGQTATSKILHIINPELFPLWDSKIRPKFGIYSGNASEYIAFMIEQKRWLSDENFKISVDKLANKYGVSTLKVIDQYNWYRAWQ